MKLFFYLALSALALLALALLGALWHRPAAHPLAGAAPAAPLVVVRKSAHAPARPKMVRVLSARTKPH